MILTYMKYIPVKVVPGSNSDFLDFRGGKPPAGSFKAGIALGWKMKGFDFVFVVI